MNTVKTNYSKEDKTYRVGDILVIVGEHDEVIDTVIVAQTTYNGVSLISLIDGNRYNEAVMVKDIDKITESELSKMSTYKRKYMKVTETTITTL